MTKRSVSVVVAVVAMVLAALASGRSTLEVRPAPESVGTPPQEPTTEPTAAPSGASRASPSPDGSQVTVNDLTLVVLQATRPADQIVAGGSRLNPTPEPGQEYARDREGDLRQGRG
ncbi:MAG: hypothetical protein PVH41_04030 [Anaerolineae bacterium]